MCCILLADRAVILFTLVLHKHRHKSLGVIFQLAAVLLKRQEFSGMLWFLATIKTTVVIIMGAPSSEHRHVTGVLHFLFPSCLKQPIGFSEAIPRQRTASFRGECNRTNGDPGSSCVLRLTSTL